MSVAKVLDVGADAAMPLRALVKKVCRLDPTAANLRDLLRLYNQKALAICTRSGADESSENEDVESSQGGELGKSARGEERAGGRVDGVVARGEDGGGAHADRAAANAPDAATSSPDEAVGGKAAPRESTPLRAPATDGAARLEPAASQPRTDAAPSRTRLRGTASGDATSTDGTAFAHKRTAHAPAGSAAASTKRPRAGVAAAAPPTQRAGDDAAQSSPSHEPGGAAPSPAAGGEPPMVPESLRDELPKASGPPKAPASGPTPFAAETRKPNAARAPARASSSQPAASALAPPAFGTPSATHAHSSTSQHRARVRSSASPPRSHARSPGSPLRSRALPAPRASAPGAGDRPPPDEPRSTTASADDAREGGRRDRRPDESAELPKRDANAPFRDRSPASQPPAPISPPRPVPKFFPLGSNELARRLTPEGWKGARIEALTAIPMPVAMPGLSGGASGEVQNPYWGRLLVLVRWPEGCTTMVSAVDLAALPEAGRAVIEAIESDLMRLWSSTPQ